MMQQINLYLPEFRRKRDPLGFDNMVLATLALVVIMTVVTATELWSSFQLGRQLDQSRSNLAQLVAETEQLIAEFGSQSEDPALTSRAAELDEEVRSKRVLTQFLTGRDMGTTDGFSEYLADLSRYHLGGLRLTSVTLSNGGNRVLLEGEVLSPHLVPQYFQSLRQGQSFAGKEFQTIRINDVAGLEDGRELKRFSVATAN